MMAFPQPHLEKLRATLENEKLPSTDRPRLKTTVKLYERWIQKLDQVKGEPEDIVSQMVGLLQEYRLHIDLDLIFDSNEDFLWRQRGQLKLDNSVVEEFLPRIIQPRTIPELKDVQVLVGPAASFSSLFFVSSLELHRVGGGPSIRSKNQDFAISKPLYIRTSHSAKFEPAESETVETNIAYVAAECKTNLDKTMFQEASMTARDTKFAVEGARYYLLAEWLDMTPLSTAATHIDEVLILRKAKRLGSAIRQEYDKSAKRKARREEYAGYLEAHPFSPEVFQRFVGHIRKLLRNEDPQERDVLESGYF